jgi:hypothetical protein
MPFRPNYRQARGERDRAKQQKKDERLRRRESDAALRKAELDAEASPTPPLSREPEAGPDPETKE